MAKKPIIGVTLDAEPPGGYSKMPWYAVRENYGDVIAKFGGVPMFLPHHPEYVGDYLNVINGLLVTGGDADVDPVLYGDDIRHPKTKTKSRRTAFEYKIVEEALKMDKPVFGICGGQQLLNVVTGGSLIQHLPDMNGPINHTDPDARLRTAHKVELKVGTKLQYLSGSVIIDVNTSHHQAVRKVGPDMVVNAVADDGVIEGIESKKHTFCLGVQWHPEYLLSPIDTSIFTAFIEAAK
jgi:putative glutamine amidotransferase